MLFWTTWYLAKPALVKVKPVVIQGHGPLFVNFCGPDTESTLWQPAPSLGRSRKEWATDRPRALRQGCNDHLPEQLKAVPVSVSLFLQRIGLQPRGLSVRDHVP